MKLSPLQVARYQYSPKLPGMLRNGISDICVCSGGATESVADQEKIKALFKKHKKDSDSADDDDDSLQQDADDGVIVTDEEISLQ